MTANQCKLLRGEFMKRARASALLSEEEISQYWKFWRTDKGKRGPLLYISKKGRTVIHIKRVEIADRRWILIQETDPKKVGKLYEIRIEGDVADVRSAFNAGLADLLR